MTETAQESVWLILFGPWVIRTFNFHLNYTKIRSLSAIFVSYKCGNGKRCTDTRLLIRREKKKEQSNIDVDYQFVI